MKFFFIIDEVLSIDLARRLKAEGHEVKCFFKNPAYRDIFEGMIDKVDNPRRYLGKKDWILIFEDTKRGRTQDRLRRAGQMVIGGSERGERLELDRAYGQAMCERMGLPVVPHKDFNNFDAAIAFVKERPQRWVIKKSGREDVRAVDYKGHDADGRDVLARLEFLKQHMNPKIPPRFTLQEYIDGVEMAVGAWFNGNDWVMPYNVNFEHQALMPGEIGPNTGEMYTTMWHRKDRDNKIFAETLEKITPFLKEAGHVGYVDLNGIVNAKGFHPLEWTVRFGMPALMLQYRLMAGRIALADFFAGLAKGTLKEHKYTEAYCVGGVIAAAPFPFAGISEGMLRRYQLTLRRYMRTRRDPIGPIFNDKFSRYVELSRNMPVFFPDDPDFLEHLHFFEMRRENGSYVTAGTDGYCFIVTDTGETPEEAGKKALERIQKIHGLPWMYRNDLGIGESEKLKKTIKFGYDVALPKTVAKGLNGSVK